MDEDMIPEETDEDEKSDKGVSSDLIRGHINTIILRALYDGDKYGYEIIAEIERKSSGQYSLKQPSLYSALKRLEKDGYIASYWGGSVGGGRRKYFSLTDEGKAVSEQNQAEWEYSRTIIDSLISDRDFDFNNPAPTAVDMRVLKRSTSRVPARDGEDDADEFQFEPVFDDTALREKLEGEYRAKEEALASDYEAKKADLEREYDSKAASLDGDRAVFEAEKSRADEEILARKREMEAEYARQTAEIEEKRKEQEELARSASAEANEALKNELELQKQKLNEKIRSHEKAMDALRETHAQELADQKAADDASLRLEREQHARNLREIGEAHAQELAAVREAAKKESEESADRSIGEAQKTYEAQLQSERLRYEKMLADERARSGELLAQERARYDAQIKDDRARYEQALADHDAELRRRMEIEMNEREKEIIHRNFISLVDAPQETRRAPADQADAPAAQTENADYRSVVGKLYENAVRPTAKPAEMTATPVSGIDFRDIETRAARDGIRVTTAGGAAKPAKRRDDSENTVHRGKALFLSAVVLFFWCLIVGSVALGVQDRLALPLFYPYVMWGVGLAILLVTGLAYANHYGENWLRRSSPAFFNVMAVYALLVIFTLIVAVSAKISFDDFSAVMTFIVFPVIYFVGVILFGLCYYILTKPKKK